MLMKLDPDFYAQHAIADMVQQFSEYMNVKFYISEEVNLTIDVKDGFQEESTLIINTFLNNILELSIQDSMNNEC